MVSRYFENAVQSTAAEAAYGSAETQRWQVLVLSAKSPPALEQATDNLLAHFKNALDINLADAAFTLQAGRRLFRHRRMLVCATINDAIELLHTRDPQHIHTVSQGQKNPTWALSLPEQWLQVEAVARQLYSLEPVFKAGFDQSAAILQSRHNSVSAKALLFAVEYALTRLWITWAGQPDGLFGQGIGYYVAQCIDANAELEDALAAALASTAEEHQSVSAADYDMILELNAGTSESQAAHHALMIALGKLYCAGVAIDWRAVHGDQRPRRIPLPTYPFEKKSCWFSPISDTSDQALHKPRDEKDADDSIEQTLITLCQQLLGVDNINVRDNIVELGANSLFTLQLSNEVVRIYGVLITPHHLFQEPTIASLAEKIRSLLPFAPAAASPSEETPTGIADPAALNEYARLLEMVENLSDEEVDRLLAAYANQREGHDGQKA